MMGAAAAASPSPDHQQTSAAAAANSETTVTPSTSEPLAASSAKRTTYEQLEKRLMGFLEPGETLEPYNSSKAVAMSHFRPFKARDTKTHLCLLCDKKVQARVNLNYQSNATSHMKIYHKAVLQSGTVFTPPPTNVERTLDDYARALSPLPIEERSRGARLTRVSAATSDQSDVVHYHLAKLCSSHLVPYSFIDWPELRGLVEACCLLPAMKVSLF